MISLTKVVTKALRSLISVPCQELVHVLSSTVAALPTLLLRLLRLRQHYRDIRRAELNLL